MDTQPDHSLRAGAFVRQPNGYRAFIPAELPPAPPIDLHADLSQLLSKADQGLGRLDGVAAILPNPDLFVAMYIKQEAVLSSQIEGTQSTLQDILALEGGAKNAGQPTDIGDIVNYIAAMNFGIKRLEDLPLSSRLIREIHEKLLANSRGQHQDSGNFRRTQNWIGPAGAGLAGAAFVPPPPHELNRTLGNLETFLNQRDVMPPLVQIGLAHGQFETIHPFLDGNGRVGRLLITLFLCERNILKRPLLYLSVYLKKYRTEYYDRLMAIRTHGDWEGWLRFFLRGVAEVSESAAATAKQIVDLRESTRQQLAKASSAKAAYRALDLIFEKPIITVATVQTGLNCSFTSANKIVKLFESLGLLVELTGQRRNRCYQFKHYLRLFTDNAAD